MPIYGISRFNFISPAGKKMKCVNRIEILVHYYAHTGIISRETHRIEIRIRSMKTVIGCIIYHMLLEIPPTRAFCCVNCFRWFIINEIIFSLFVDSSNKAYVYK